MSDLSIKPKVALIGDTSLRTSHFGCQLVGQTFREQFARVGFDLVVSLPSKLSLVTNWKSYLEGVDLVVINGEGSIHHGRFQELINLASEFPCALVNCVYQDNPPNDHLINFKYVSVRESYSAHELQNAGIKAEVVPDVLFASMFLRSFVPKAHPSKESGMTDNAKKEVFKIGSFQLKYRPGFSPKTPVVADYLDFLCTHKKMAIGRFHAAICCCVLGIPFSTWDSNTWKTKGLMEDIGVSHLHFEERSDAVANMPDSLPEKIKLYTNKSIASIEKMFNALKHLTQKA